MSVQGYLSMPFSWSDGPVSDGYSARMHNMKSVLTALVLCALSAGCAVKDAVSNGPSGPPDPNAEQNFQKDAAQMTAAAWPTGVKIHRNKEGKVVCGVMGDEIASPDKANSFQDYKGERYYFCCGACPDQFKKDPEKYADKADPKKGDVKATSG